MSFNFGSNEILGLLLLDDYEILFCDKQTQRKRVEHQRVGQWLKVKPTAKEGESGGGLAITFRGDSCRFATDTVDETSMRSRHDTLASMSK